MLYPPEYNIVLFCKKRNGFIKQTYISAVSDYGRDYYPVWIYPIKITTLVHSEISAWSNSGSMLIYQNITAVNTSNNRIAGHCFGFDSGTPTTRYGFVVIGY